MNQEGEHKLTNVSVENHLDEVKIGDFNASQD